MHRRRFLTVVTAASLAGCSALSRDPEPSRLDLTVQNDRSGPVTAKVSVTGEDGTTYEETSDQIDSGVARAFEVVAGEEGRHEVTVSGADWEGQLAWNADTCSLFDARVHLTAEGVAVAGECVNPR